MQGGQRGDGDAGRGEKEREREGKEKGKKKVTAGTESFTRLDGWDPLHWQFI